VGAAEEARFRDEFLDTGTVIEPVRVIDVLDESMDDEATASGPQRSSIRSPSR
jgi:hypothetical protein